MNNKIRFNPLHYEERLSMFGKKVLHELVKKWRTDRTRNINATQQRFHQSTPVPAQKRRVLTFRSEQPFNIANFPAQTITTDSMIDNPLIYDTNLDNITENNEINNFNENRPIEIKTVDNLININEPDVLLPLDDNITSDYIQNNLNVQDSSTLLDVVNPNIVDWNDMFDTELIPDIINHNTVPPEKVPENANITEVSEIETVVSKEIEILNSEISNVVTKNKVTEHNSKKTKRKSQKITDNIPKKVKKDIGKQNYSAVKNWLNDVNPNNPVEETKTGEMGTKIEIVLENKVNKKTIQSQLTNKDGIMKFSKPVKTNEQNAIKNDTVTMNDENRTKNDSKLKKAKPKFIAPIKSQIPVKDITYEVKVVDNNIMEYKNELFGVKDKCVVALLVYRNGFSDLNKQHTEDDCDSEGVLINIDDQLFYYLKNITTLFREIINSLMHANKIICYEGKNLLGYLKCGAEIDIYGVEVIDTKIGAQLLEPDSTIDTFTDVQKLVSFNAQFTITTECCLQKAAWYSTLLRECSDKMISMLREQALWKVFVDIEMKLLPVITDMEQQGVLVDLDKLKYMEEILMSKMKVVEQQCYKAAGKVFQINSTVQVRSIIYDELELDAKCNIKIRETLSIGAKSTSEAMLRNLINVHSLPKLILEYRHLHKAHATFVSGIAQHVRDGVVKPTWVQLAAATGRIASNNPNLQAIPKAPFELVMFPENDEHIGETRETHSGTPSDVSADSGSTLVFRSVYTCVSGRRLLCADFKHVECRVFAHLARDAALTAALHARDLFTVLAAQWLQKDEADVTSSERERTKRVVYAVLYGAGARKLHDVLRVDYQQALAIHSSFNRTFPSLKRFWSAVSAESERAGRLRSACGRARAARGHTHDVNFVIQGSAADLCKLSMVLTSERFRSHDPPVAAHLILQIHDELVWEVEEHHLDLAAGIIKEVMEGCGRECGMFVPLPVAITVGRNWGEMMEYQPLKTSHIPQT